MSVNQDVTTLQVQMSEVSSEVGRSLGVSRLEASLLALKFVQQGLKEFPLLLGSFAVDSTEKPLSSYPSISSVLKVAFDLGDYGFTLDDLIEAVGPDMIIRPKAYKNQLSRALRSKGFFQKQVRKEGKRPLLWFHPDRCGGISE